MTAHERLAIVASIARLGLAARRQALHHHASALLGGDLAARRESHVLLDLAEGLLRSAADVEERLADLHGIGEELSVLDEELGALVVALCGLHEALPASVDGAAALAVWS